MRVHNLVKDLVIQRAEEMFSRQAELEAKGLCASADCLLDVVCYVLNRVPPEYVVSGRGVAHSETGEYNQKLQRLADITRLIHEGMEVVTRNRRPRGSGSFEHDREGIFFNFPSIIGRLFNGVTFEPIAGVSVSLKDEQGSLVRVIDPNWQNPYAMVPNTAGTFLFWPHPVRAEEENLERRFLFTLAVDDEQYEPFRYAFPLEVSSRPQFMDFVNTTASHRLKDLYLFPRE